jgi:hypothetical protein
MARIATFLCLCAVCMSGLAQTASPRQRLETDQAHTAWINDVLRAIETIKPGMTRSDLEKIFTTEGGLSTSSQRTYVYRQCRHIKVDVRFAASVRDAELPTDKIVDISRPYLAWSTMD